MGMIRIGLVGCGTIGRIHAGIISSLKGAALSAVADSNPQQAGELNQLYGCRQFYDYRDMLKCRDIDLVSVCVPPALHYQVVTDAAAAGKHVIVEKPMAVSLERADRMIEACRKHGVIFSVIFQHRFDPVVQALKKADGRGELGKLLMGTSRTLWYRDCAYYAVSWRGTCENGGGALMNQSIHYIDLLQYIMGDVDAVSAVCGTLLHKTIQVEDTGIAVLRFKSGAVGSIEGTTIAYPGLYSELSFYGENGVISIRNDKLDYYHMKTGVNPELEELAAGKTPVEAAVSKPENLDLEPHRKQYEDVLAAIREGREPLVNGEEGRKSIALINAIYEASRRKEWVSLDSIT